MTTKEIDKQFSFTDARGNVFKCRNKQLSLKIPSNDKALEIGKITMITSFPKNVLIYAKTEKEGQVHHNTNGWTVPLDILNKVEGLWYRTEKYHYKILKSIALMNHENVHFRDPSKFESKVSIPIRFWEKTER